METSKVIKALREENQLLKNLVNKASIFVDDVLPQLGKLTIQDFANLNELCVALSENKKKDRETND